MNKNTEQGVPAYLAPGCLAWHVVPTAQDSPSLSQACNSSLKRLCILERKFSMLTL